MSKDLEKCFKCKEEKAVYVMKDKLITKNKWAGFCKPCYGSYFKEFNK